MKKIVRCFAVSLVVIGFAAGAMTSKTSTAGVQLVSVSAPMPVCMPGTSDCGLGKGK